MMGAGVLVYSYTLRSTICIEQVTHVMDFHNVPTLSNTCRESKNSLRIVLMFSISLVDVSSIHAYMVSVVLQCVRYI